MGHGRDRCRLEGPERLEAVTDIYVCPAKGEKCTGCDTCVPLAGSLADQMRPSRIKAREAAERERVRVAEARIREIVREEIKAALAEALGLTTAT